MEHNNKYLINIFDRYSDLKKSNKQEYDNNDLWKIFEYYSCLKLSEEYKKPFYEYDDIDPNFKEINKMSRNDTGIDCSDLDKTIVQCKLRKNTLTWKECSTFFGSQNIFSSELKKPIVRWENLIITRNTDCTLSENLLERKELFIDKPYDKNELITFCENLIINSPSYPVFNENFKLRDYQIEAINMVKENKKNVIINLPTGTGKNSVIIYSFLENKKYLILVPRIILMDQFKKEIIKHFPKMKNNIQLIGDSNNTFDENKLITICVFNSVHLIENYCMNFEKIFIDEAHHINKPAIYYENEDDEYTNNNNITVDNDSMDTEDIIQELNGNSNNDSEEYYSDDESIITEETKDDIEDELVNVKNYTKIINSLVQYSNNVYLSATIDSTDNFEHYSKDIRSMIDLKYLCDYQIHVPIFSDDPTNKNICEYLLKNYRNIIIYCNSQKEGKLVNKLMNGLQLNSSEYIDCNTSKKSRDDIINKYKDGEIPFLINVRILVEGFDAPITKGVCFLHLPTNKTTLIQIIGRSLRLHSTKTIANIILPFSSREDEKNICNFLKVMAKNDSRIRKSFENKQLGGYISINIINNDEDIEFKYDMIYNSMGILLNGEDIWMKRLEDLKEYIDKNNKRPSEEDKKHNIKQLGMWTSHQIQNYKNENQIMKGFKIRKTWEEFIEKYKFYFYNNEQKFYKNLQKVIEYIDYNNKRPSSEDNNIIIKKLGVWCLTQTNNYNKNQYIMKEDKCKNTWKEFIEKYKFYFQSNEEIWINKLEELKNYIDNNNKIPSRLDKNGNIKKLGAWLNMQNISYKKTLHIMKEEKIKKIWEEFIDKYKIYFQSDEEEIINKLEKIKEYIDKNNKRPSSNDKNIEISHLGSWLITKTEDYNKNQHIMKKENLRKIWEGFIEKYKSYFLSNEEVWENNLENVKKYIDINNKKPTRCDKNKQIIILANWINSQSTNYKTKYQIMSNEEIYNKWTEFINNQKYKKYFQSNEDEWNNKLNEVIQYIDTNDKKPSNKSINKHVKTLDSWIKHQKDNYKNKKHIMSNEKIYKQWTKFINDPKYAKYF